MQSTSPTTSLASELRRRLSPETLRLLQQSLTTSITNPSFLDKLKSTDVLVIYWSASQGQEDPPTYLRLFKRPKTKA